jgi:transmembrane sensor
MAGEAHQDVLDEAIAWQLRLQTARGEDWDAFTLWLEGDPARSDAYDQVEAAHAALGAEAFPPAAVPVPVAANDEAPRSRRLWPWATAFAALAAVILVAFVTLPMLRGPDRYEIATRPGEQRNVVIADGSSAMLNGGTRLILDRNDPRYAELTSGEVTFTVRHDDAHPFMVVSGDHHVQDVGTVFNLISDRGDFSVEVIDGAVLYNPEREAVSLSAGQTLTRSAGGQAVVARADPQAMAGWRRGQLSYAGAPMRRVAGDVSRTLGVPVSVDGGAAGLPFTGSIRIQRDPAATVGDLASSVGLHARRTGTGWTIEPQPRAPR